jgi:protocatechuate 3,4-dioxygenase beta subunit
MPPRGNGAETSVQFSMVAARLVRLSGTVVDADGLPVAGASLSIITATGSGMTSFLGGQTAADGTFTVSGIAPGEHTLRATRTAAGPGGDSAAVPVTVGSSDVAGLRLTLGPGATITGRVVFEGTASRTAGPVPLRVIASQADPQRQVAMFGGPFDPLANGTVAEDGTFKLAGASGRVFFGLTPLPAWVVKSVTLDGEDITDVPFDLSDRAAISDVRIVVTDKLTTVSGQAADRAGRPVKDYVVVIQSAEPKEPIVASRWIRLVRPDTNGRFETRGLRPGRYVATAVEALEQGQQFAPDVQTRLRSAGRTFEIEEGASATVALELTNGF